MFGIFQPQLLTMNPQQMLQDHPRKHPTKHTRPWEVTTTPQSTLLGGWSLPWKGTIGNHVLHESAAQVLHLIFGQYRLPNSPATLCSEGKKRVLTWKVFGFICWSTSTSSSREHQFVSKTKIIIKRPRHQLPQKQLTPITANRHQHWCIDMAKHIREISLPSSRLHVKVSV